MSLEHQRGRMPVSPNIKRQSCCTLFTHRQTSPNLWSLISYLEKCTPELVECVSPWQVLLT